MLLNLLRRPRTSSGPVLPAAALWPGLRTALPAIAATPSVVVEDLQRSAAAGSCVGSSTAPVLRKPATASASPALPSRCPRPSVRRGSYSPARSGRRGGSSRRIRQCCRPNAATLPVAAAARRVRMRRFLEGVDVEFAPPRVVEVEGRRLAYEEVSPDESRGTVLLLCGIGAKRQGWYKQLPVLGARYRTLALDYRDVGDSDQSDRPYSIRDLAEDVYGLAEQLGIASASLIGISMGGFVALELALACPEFVDRLILVVTSAGGATHVATSREVMAALMPGEEEVESGEGARRVCSLVAGPGFAQRHPEAIEEFVAIALHNPLHVDAYLRQLAACRAHDVAERLAEIGAPTLVIHGDADPLVRIENGRLLAANISDADLIVYEGVGHIPEVECVERFNADLLRFLP
jgi:3-oxoadipate enol-lactonase